MGEALPYPKYRGDVVLGKSFHHGRFISNLRNACKTLSNVDLVEGIAREVLETEKGEVTGVKYKKGEEVREVKASLTVVADGCFSNFRSKMGIEKPTSCSHFVGLIMEDCQLPHPKHGHVFICQPSPILMYQIGGNEIRVLVDVPNPLPSASTGALAKYLKEQTAPQLPEQLQQHFLNAITKDKIRSMPNQKLHTQSKEKAIRPGLILLGDSWNMRHPLTGGGMTVALSDVVQLKNSLETLRSLEDKAAVVQKLNSTYYVTRKPLATTINILANALYSVFCGTDDPILPQMQQACLGYFQLGGEAVAGPMSLLSGLCDTPNVLIRHFFLVALYGVYHMLKPFPTPMKLIRSYQLLGAASWIVIPLMRGERVFGWFTWIIALLFAARKPKHLREQQS